MVMELMPAGTVQVVGGGELEVVVWQSRHFLYVGAYIFTPHIAAPIYLLCLCCAYIMKYVKIHM